MWAEDTSDIENGTNDVDDFISGYVRTDKANISFKSLRDSTSLQHSPAFTTNIKSVRTNCLNAFGLFYYFSRYARRYSANYFVVNGAAKSRQFLYGKLLTEKDDLITDRNIGDMAYVYR